MCHCEKFYEDEALVARIKSEKEKLAAMKYSEKKVRILHLLWGQAETETETRLSLMGVPVLKECFCELLGITRWMLDTMRKAQKDGHMRPPLDGRTGGTTHERDHTASLTADKFFLWTWCTLGQPFAEELDPEDDIAKLKVNPNIDDFHFDSDNQVTRLIEDPAAHILSLPARTLVSTTITELFDHFESWCAGAGIEACSYSTFLNVWNKNWNNTHLRMRKLSPHARCEDCARFAEARKRAETDEQRRDIMHQYYEHLKGQYEDRTVYSRIESLSEAALAQDSKKKKDHTSILSLAIDGMDQAKFRLPRNLCSSKLWDKLWRPQVHMVGVLVNGSSDHYFLEDQDMKKDASNNCELLSITIQRVVDECKAKNIPLPMHLHVHADNTGREQKNKTGLGFLGVLVGKKIFTTATQSHFMKGHTHFQLDQKFSTIGSRLASTGVMETIQDFKLAIEQSFETNLSCTIVDGSRDWKSLLENLGMQLHGHTGPKAPHQFMLVRRSHLVEDGATDLIVSRGGWGIDVEDHPDDVILLTKAFMRDTQLSQMPVLFIPHKVLHELGSAAPTEVNPRNEIPDQHRTKYLTTAREIEKEPWALKRAAAYLREWVATNKTLQKTPMTVDDLTPLPFFSSPEKMEDPKKIDLKNCFTLVNYISVGAAPKRAATKRTKILGKRPAGRAEQPDNGQAEAVVELLPPQPAAGGRKRKRLQLPEGMPESIRHQLGCSKCRRVPTGRGTCRKKAGVTVSPDGEWTF
ncbi:unnamed protein product [Prorocentrum cordatum]|uniref:DUF7869 domain-containing protein n=1 Tax=Prorocentrum cordatum TaxID=2364126 RepID=A0ABN9V5C2_9DINO|nr:unnamed protein product [Polarella glacialis]